MTSTARIAIVAVTIFAAASAARAQSQGPNAPGTLVSDASFGTNPWASPGNAAVSDNMYAGALPLGVPTQYLKVTNFGLSIPAAAIVNGIVVQVERSSAAGLIHDASAKIVKGGVVGGTDHGTLTPWPTTDAVATFGSGGDLWGLTWTPADINGGGFGFAISATDNLDAAGVDQITITVYYSLCGDTIIGPGEECDDGNVLNGDCCSSTCQFESGPCPDSDLCNGDETCNLGTCVPGTPLTCTDSNPCTQDSCDSMTGCVNAGTPLGGCRTAGKGLLLIKNNTDNTRDKLVWKWLKGQATTFADFGVPTGTTAYTLCVYDNTGSVLGATVAGGPSWTVFGTNKGYKYADPSGASSGIQKGKLKAGGGGKAKEQFKGKGTNLPDPTLPLVPPVVAQLVSNANSICYTTPLNTIKKNSTSLFKAKQ